MRGADVRVVCPLQDARIDLRGVYAVLKAQGMKAPSFFWARLYDAVCNRMSSSAWQEKLSDIERDILFSGRTRGNCSFCFFQRQYEYIWLMETHPDLWAEAKSFENVGSQYTWRQGYALADLEEPSRKDKIFESRVKYVCGVIRRKEQLNLFQAEADTDIALHSCGMFCGK